MWLVMFTPFRACHSGKYPNKQCFGNKISSRTPRGTARRNEANKYKALFEIKIRSHGFEGLRSNRQSQLEKEVYSYRESLYIDSLY